ncbi:Rad4-domain-containing protein [Aspergillus unguis]
MSSRTRPGPARGAPRSRRSRRHEDEDEIPEVYRDMLAEAEARESAPLEDNRPKKRLKPTGYWAPPVKVPVSQETNPPDAGEDTIKDPQTVYSSPSESDESDLEWEEVDIQQPAISGPSASVNDEPLQITFGQQQEARRKIVRRKPVTGAEKKHRLDVHKTHLLCLLCHVQRRNLWCNDEEVQGSLRRILSKHIRSQLNPPEDKPQHTRSAMFLDGLNQAGDVFFRKFTVTKPGLRRPYWAADSDALKRTTKSIMSDAEVFLSRKDFRNQAKTMQGSRDFGAQLFCALLRSVAVEARLVCSLQPLPLSGTVQIPPKPEPDAIVISSDDPESLTDGNKSEGKPKPIRRIAQPSFNPQRARTSFTTRPKPRESSYPVFWVEVLNEAFQKWVVIDPMVTKTLAKPHRLEPPATDPYNLLSYVVAFEEDASARDVTRRYTKAFNAKIRKLRVESTKNGDAWWNRVLQQFEKPFLEDRDEIEIGELTAKTASEPMPRNIQDFKDHPIYALERQLRHNEVIFPKRVTGHVSLGKTGAKGQSEPVYRRSDVHTLRSANKWYRLGRDIKIGEQALKRVPARNRGLALDGDDDDAEETALYAFFQTEVYKPPPVVQGRIPKNAYGNLDIYVPSMVPPGGVHIRHQNAAYAARLLGIDYADAVTGFNFKGRHGTAILQGIVVANEYREAVVEVLKCLEEEVLQNRLEQRSAEVLRAWKHLLLKLRIAERVKGYAVEGEADDEASAMGKSEPEEGGGFFPESDVDADQDMGGGFLPDDTVPPTLEQPEIDQEMQPLTRPDGLDGGFLPVDDARAVPSPRQTATRQSHYSIVVVPGASSTGGQDPNLPQETGNMGTSAEEPIAIPSSVDESTPGDVKTPITVDSSGPNPVPASVEVLSRAPSEDRTPALSMDVDSEENEGSLLSEDPEDEDAVPEWLFMD